MFFILCDIIYFWWDCRGNLKLNGLNGWKCIRNFANVMFLWGFCHLEWVCLKRKSEVVDTPLPSRTNPRSPWWSIQISPAASPEILHHTVWRTWLFIAYSDERHYTTNSHYCTSLIHFLLKCWENVLFELGSERVDPFSPEIKKYIPPNLFLRKW